MSDNIDDNGCYFCGECDGDDLVYSDEFDTFVHIGCIEDNRDGDPEAEIMAAEFDLD